MAELESDIGVSHGGRQQRLAPLAMHQLEISQRKLLEKIQDNDANPRALISTLAHSPGLLKKISGMERLFYNCSIAAIDRELAILSVAAFCRSRYLFSGHASIARSVGITHNDLEHLWSFSTPSSWSETQVAIVSFVNELLANDSISDESWEAAPFRDDPVRMVELISMIGFYRMIAGLTNATRMDLRDFQFSAQDEKDGGVVPE